MGGKHTSIIIVLASIALAAGAVDYKRERYNVIVDRSPFGEDPTLAIEQQQDLREQQAAAAAAKKLEKEIRLCFLLESESGEVRAGFQNLKAAKGDPKSIMLMVGESFRGMQLKGIDLANNSATLDINGKPVAFELASAPAPKAVPAKKPTQTPRRFGRGFRPKPPAPAKPPEPQLTPEEQAAKREEVQENLRQYQMEVIRAGMPPLPIPLTKEMDDQLVAEGVLPPGEE